MTTADEIRANRRSRTQATPEVKRRLDDELITLIHRGLEEGLLVAQIADMSGIPRKRIYQIRDARR